MALLDKYNQCARNLNKAFSGREPDERTTWMVSKLVQRVIEATTPEAQEQGFTDLGEFHLAYRDPPDMAKIRTIVQAAFPSLNNSR